MIVNKNSAVAALLQQLEVTHLLLGKKKRCILLVALLKTAPLAGHRGTKTLTKALTVAHKAARITKAPLQAIVDRCTKFLESQNQINKTNNKQAKQIHY